MMPVLFSTFRTSVESLLKQSPMTGPRRHKLTSQSDAPYDQLRSLRPLGRATLHNKTCDILRPRKDLAKTSRSIGEVAEDTSPSDFALILGTGLRKILVDLDRIKVRSLGVCLLFELFWQMLGVQPI